MTTHNNSQPDETFNYARFSQSAMAVVRTASYFALSAGHGSVLPSDFAAAAAGGQPTDRPVHREGVSQFDASSMVILHRSFDDAVKEGRLIEPEHLAKAFL